MCGIAGSVNFKLPYSIINQYMIRRGPDEQRGYVCDNIDFYHLRLSILDISGGKQPMELNDRYTIVFNGEIYNHNDLRKKHSIKGITSSDTETLLWLYHLKGPEMLHELEGMFAFAIYDRQLKKMFIARDRAGKKPLYYYTDTEKLVFASELNCIRRVVAVEMEKTGFYNYLRLGSFYRQQTPYKQVSELRPGHYLEINCAQLNVQEISWWSINQFFEQVSKDSLPESIEKVDGFLHAAIKRRLESSDLEVGSFLSGGIDSGLVTSIASHYRSNLKTFTVSFAGEYDEAPLARLVSEKYQTRHTEINISFDNLKNDLEGILTNYGEPFFDSSAIPSYYASVEAKKHLTVILNGDGADELFGGYRRYVPFAQYDFFDANFMVKSLAKGMKSVFPPSDNKKSMYNFFYRLVSLATKRNVEIYFSAGMDIFEDCEEWFTSSSELYIDPIRQDFNKIVEKNISGLRKIMNMDFNTALCCDFLVKMDIANMSNSLEGRSPFLCKELLEYAPTMNDSYKVNGKITKHLLRQLSKKYLPEEIISQPKRGFEIPLKNWVDNELKEIVYDYVGAKNSLWSEFVQREFIEKLLNNRVKISAEKRAKILWTLMSMEIWYKKVYLQ